MDADAAFTPPIVSFSFADDAYLSAANIDSRHGFYAGASRQMTRFALADVGESRIGHCGFFRERLAVSLWERHLLPALA